ncbi:hypothetical protein [Brevibacterium aurantiacum]|uniref:hypothetical protein n=1 Tax=Brevibacterium aurantiacum TaxID=273384 RepID=UPI001867BE32|nr:hypothetical protein [Brevibacterium aurantiacum]
MVQKLLRITATIALVSFSIVFVVTNHEDLYQFFSGVFSLSWWTAERIKMVATLAAGIVAYGGFRTALASYQINRNNLELTQKARVAGIGVSWNFDSKNQPYPPQIIISNANDSLVNIDELAIYGYGFQSHYFQLSQTELHPGSNITFDVPRAFWFDILAVADQSIATPGNHIDTIVQMRDIENVYWSRDASRSVERGTLTESHGDSFSKLARLNLVVASCALNARLWYSETFSKDNQIQAEAPQFWLDSLDPLAQNYPKAKARKAITSGIITNSRLAPGRPKSPAMPRHLSARDASLAEMYQVLYSPRLEKFSYYFHQGEDLTTEKAIAIENLESELQSISSSRTGDSHPAAGDVGLSLDRIFPDRLMKHLLYEYSSLDASAQILGSCREFTDQFVSIQAAIDNNSIFDWLVRNFEVLSHRNIASHSKLAAITRSILQRFAPRLHFYEHGVAEIWVPKKTSPACVPAIARHRVDLAVWWPLKRTDLTLEEQKSTLSRLEFINTRDVWPYGDLAIATSRDGISFPFPTKVDYNSLVSRNERLAVDLCNYYGFYSSSLDGYRNAVEQFTKSIDCESQTIDLNPLWERLK